MTEEPDAFYVTICKPGRAEGCNDWNDYSAYREDVFPETEELSYMDEEFDDEGRVRALTYFFKDD